MWKIALSLLSVLTEFPNFSLPSFPSALHNNFFFSWTKFSLSLSLSRRKIDGTHSRRRGGRLKLNGDEVEQQKKESQSCTGLSPNFQADFFTSQKFLPVAE